MHDVGIEDLKAQVLALFPIGSKWYDCLRDEVGEVALHFPPRGIVLVRRFRAIHLPLLPPEKQKTVWDRVARSWTLNPRDYTREAEERDHVEIMRYGYSELLDGLLVEPVGSSEAARELFEGYRKRREETNRDFDQMRSEHGFAEAEMWGHPVG